jgi:hypothetical protein
MTNVSLIGKTVQLPNGDTGIVQDYAEGRYTVINGHGIGRAVYVDPQDIKLPKAEKVSPKLPGF